MKRWYAAMCKPLQDQRAEHNLLAQGYEVLRPLAKVHRRRAGKRCTVIESLFPRYLFIHLDDQTENWAPIRSTFGVAGLVRFGSKLALVPDAVISDIRCRLDETSCCIDLTVNDAPRRNSRVRIVDGPFAGHEALFQARSGEERVIVLLSIMQQPQRLAMPADAIEYASSG